MSLFKTFFRDFLSLGSKYENSGVLDCYIRAQYGTYFPGGYDRAESFYHTLEEMLAPFIIPETRALDVGCATGRTTFAIARMGARHVVGIDTSKRFIQTCKKINAGAYTPELVSLSNPGTVSFVRGDVSSYHFKDASFDLISCINVIDRDPHPRKLVARLHDLLTSDGILLLVDPYDWELSPTPRRERVGDMKELLDSDRWEIISEVRDIRYVIPIDKKHAHQYSCHAVIAKKRL